MLRPISLLLAAIRQQFEMAWVCCPHLLWIFPSRRTVWTGHSFYDTFARVRWPQGDEPQWDEDVSFRKYDGYSHVANTKQTRMRSAHKGDRVGLLLDLDAGILAIYKNDTRLGVVSNGLAGGEYCWAATLFTAGSAVRIEQKPAPDVDGDAEVLYKKRRRDTAGDRRKTPSQTSEGHSAKRNAVAQHDHTFSSDRARNAFDSAAHPTPAAADVAAVASIPLVHVRAVPTPTLIPSGPPEPTNAPTDEPTEEEVVGVPTELSDEEEVTSIPVTTESEAYALAPSGDSDACDDQLEAPTWALPAS